MKYLKIIFPLLFIGIVYSNCEKTYNNYVNVPTTQTGLSQISDLPIGTYTSYGLNWCTNGSCNSTSTPAACASVTTFGNMGGDFTVYSDTSATFWNSIPEPVSYDLTALQVTLTSSTTGHQGYSFTYQYLGGAPAQWEVTYGVNCGRLYICHLGACLP